MPRLDTIFHDRQLGGFSIRFIPDAAMSAKSTELIFITETAAAFPNLQTFWNRLEKLFAHTASLTRIVHGDGAAYTFHFADSGIVELDTLSPTRASEAIDRLRQIADTAEVVFLDQRYLRVA